MIFKLDSTMTFGKYKGVSLRELITDNPVYVKWCTMNVEFFKLDYVTERLLANSSMPYQTYSGRISYPMGFEPEPDEFASEEEWQEYNEQHDWYTNQDYELSMD